MRLLVRRCERGALQEEQHWYPAPKAEHDCLDTVVSMYVAVRAHAAALDLLTQPLFPASCGHDSSAMYSGDKAA